MASDPQSKVRLFVILLLLGVIAYGIGLSFFAYSWSAGPNYRNVTVDTKVNITGSAPVVLRVTPPQSAITLTAGSLTPVECNVSIRDYNGFADISNVNATLFHSSSTFAAADDNNTHYTNTSCVNITGQQNGAYTNYSCTFQVNYYALNGTWNCTAQVNDTRNLRGNGTNTTNVSALYALNVTPTVDYGDLSMGDYSDNVSVNVTNLGNLKINVSVAGYGQTWNDGLAFKCDQGNFTVGTQHFSTNASANYSQKQTLTGALQTIGNMSVFKAINATPTLNESYWEFYADVNQVAYGNCTGFLVFQANAG